MGRKFLQEFSYNRFRFHAAPRDMQNFHERRPLVKSPLPLVKAGKNESFEICWGQPISLASFSFPRASKSQACLQATDIYSAIPTTRPAYVALPKFADQDWDGFSLRLLKGFDHLSLGPWNYGLNYLSYDSCTWEDSGSCIRTGQDWCTTRGMWLKTPERSDLIYRRTWVRSSTAVCHEKFGEMHHCNKDISAVVQWLMYF